MKFRWEKLLSIVLSLCIIANLAGYRILADEGDPVNTEPETVETVQEGSPVQEDTTASDPVEEEKESVVEVVTPASDVEETPAVSDSVVEEAPAEEVTEQTDEAVDEVIDEAIVEEIPAEEEILVEENVEEEMLMTMATDAPMMMLTAPQDVSYTDTFNLTVGETKSFNISARQNDNNKGSVSSDTTSVATVSGSFNQQSNKYTVTITAEAKGSAVITVNYWTKSGSTWTSHANYYLVNVAAQSYTVTFVDHDGTSSTSYEDGTAAANITLPTTPADYEDAKNTYTFEKWDPEIADVTADATYTAKYTATPKESYMMIISDISSTYVGSSIQMSVDTTAESVVWSVSDESIATIDENGKLTGVAAGKVTVTVANADGTLTDSMDVTVSDPKVGDKGTISFQIVNGTWKNVTVPYGATISDDGTTITFVTTYIAANSNKGIPTAGFVYTCDNDVPRGEVGIESLVSKLVSGNPSAYINPDEGYDAVDMTYAKWQLIAGGIQSGPAAGGDGVAQIAAIAAHTHYYDTHTGGGYNDPTYTFSGNTVYQITLEKQVGSLSYQFSGLDNVDESKIPALPKGETDITNGDKRTVSTQTYGDIVVDNGYYTFDGWDKSGEIEIVGDVVVTGSWTFVDYLKITYKFTGSVPPGILTPDDQTPVDSNNYKSGDSYTVDTTFKNGDTRKVEDAYNNLIGLYTFGGWNATDGTITSSMTIEGEWSYEEFELTKYSIKYEWAEGTTEDVTDKYDVPTDSKEYVNNQPYKISETTYDSFDLVDDNDVVIGTYTFDGWTSSDETGKIPGDDVTITGSWTFEYATYLVHFMDEDRTTELGSALYNYGSVVTDPGLTPTKASDGTYTYTFSGWTPAFVAVRGEAYYYATYTSTRIVPPGPPIVPPTPDPDPVPTPVPTPPVTPDVTPVDPDPTPVEPEVIPEDTTPEAEVIPEDTTPEAGEQPVWALANLLMSIGAAILSVVTLLFKKKNDDEEEETDENGVRVVKSEEDEEEDDKYERRTWPKALGVVIAVVGAVLFILTENMSNPMVWFDKYTIAHLLLTVGQCVNTYLGGQKLEPKEEEEEQANA